MLATLVVTLGFAGAAQASSISFIWISTSGAGVGVGTPTLTGVSTSDTAVLEIRVGPITSPGLNAIGVSVTYGAGVSGTAQTACPATASNFFGNNAPGSGSCGGFTGNVADFLSILESSTGAGANSSFVVNAGGPTNGQPTGNSFELAHITFHADAGGIVAINPFFRGGIDGEVPQGGGFFVPPASGAIISVIPEPGTAALLVLGLGALAFAGRRR